MSRYQHLFTSIDHGVVFQDHSGAIVEANAAAVEILGLATHEIHGRSSHDPRWQAVRADGSPFPGDEHPAMVALRTAKPVRNVVMGVFNPAEGVRRWIKVSSTPLVEDEGQPPALVVTIFDDITEAWRTTEALRASEERFRLIAECTNDVLYEWDLRTDRLDYFGKTRPELPTTGPITAPGVWADLLHPDERDDILAAVHDTIANQSVFMREHRMRRPGGDWGEVITKGLVLPDAEGRPARWLGATSDITSQRAAERAREESMSLFQAVIEISRDPIYVRDTHGRFRMVNAAAAEVLGAPPQDVIGRPNDDFIPAEVCVRMAAREGRVLETGQPMTYEAPGWGRETGRSYLVTKLPLRDHTDAITGTVTIARDITEMKSLEARLRYSQKMEAIGRLAGGIAHDFNNLLTVIMGCCTDLQEQALPRPAAMHVDEILRAAERAAVLTRQLLAFSRRQVLAPRVVDLNAVIGNAERMFRRIVGEDISFQTYLAEDLGSVHVDPGQIEQVLLNLVVNARDAMPHGGQLTIETANVEYDEAIGRQDVPPGRHVVLTVSDTGVGMDRQTLSNIFEPFFTTKPHGTGLGLSTVYGIVKQSGGDISAYSEPGIGTSFKVLLPRHDAPAETTDAATPGRHSSGSELILLAEDEGSLRDLLARALTRAGYRVVAAGSGEEALELLAALPAPPPLLITDLIMPGMDGRSLARHVRERLPEIRVLFISGYADHAVLDHGMLGAQDQFLQKPFTPAVLTQRVRALLDSSV